MFKKLRKFLREVSEETKRVSWPSKEEVVNSSLVVIVFILLLSVILGIVDFLSSTLIGLLLR